MLELKRNRTGNPVSALAVLTLLVLATTACGVSSDAGPAVVKVDPEPSDEEFSAAHVLIQYVGAVRAQEGIYRGYDEARVFAEELRERIRNGEDLATIARENSDGPSAPFGGNLGLFQGDRMTPAFTEAVRELEIGEVSDVVETEFGFHIIRRDEIEAIRARHILVMHKEAANAPATIERSRDEARAFCSELRDRVLDGQNFAELAGEFSDGPSKVKGGDLGRFGRGQMVPEFETVAFALADGETSDVIETDLGFHIIQRY